MTCLYGFPTVIDVETSFCMTMKSRSVHCLLSKVYFFSLTVRKDLVKSKMDGTGLELLYL